MLVMTNCCWCGNIAQAVCEPSETDWQQLAEKAEAQAASYRQALEAIRLLTLDPWQMGIAANVRGLCEEALGNGKP